MFEYKALVDKLPKRDREAFLKIEEEYYASSKLLQHKSDSIRQGAQKEYMEKSHTFTTALSLLKNGMFTADGPKRPQLSKAELLLQSKSKDLLKMVPSFAELLMLVDDKPALIEKKKQAIKKIQEEIKQLEGIQLNNSYSLLNPKRFFNKLSTEECAREIEELQREISNEETEIKNLQAVESIELFDVSKISTEMELVLNTSKSKLDEMAEKVLTAQKQYFDLLKQYGEIKSSASHFSNEIKKTIDSEYQKVAAASQNPTYPNQPSKRFIIPVTLEFDPRIREGHIERIIDFHGQITNEVMKRP
ncbi:hypothetical protein [Lysinibacillus fusiformis]|uniref:hypothetical protein n=1 Tax=Lysinibacillus fusiformis TaxID=28031 RepID=UPI000D3BE8EE|nr:MULTISPECIES: hypothetical protein [Lysinibacillus]MED4668157.1 hypothetical protein [Lysinibacillus fusiformis]QAS58556.1 hypothetical protein LSP_20645 [Lysinibacillus sphaericus]RDV35446.1 hypothetical protein C7B90_02470 [Lysinibacillus fusiformis]GED63921.1 hypothetical protein LFU01_23730 [Lysinibacillus fusiformis]